MQQTSELYQSILRNNRHRKEVKVVIAGEEYNEDHIVSLSTDGGAFASVGQEIGNCVSRQIDLSLLNPGTIPKRAEIRPYFRLVLDDQQSEWLPKGVFYISTRGIDKRTGALTIHGYDAMRKAGDTWITSDYDYENWPMSEADAVADIAQRMGVEVDPRTELDGLFPVDYPVDENGDMAMEDILCGIAAINCGNWIMSDEGKLWLIRFGGQPEETNYLVEEHGDVILFGGVRILV